MIAAIESYTVALAIVSDEPLGMGSDSRCSCYSLLEHTKVADPADWLSWRLEHVTFKTTSTLYLIAKWLIRDYWQRYMTSSCLRTRILCK
jgi:hypothetical protein